MAQSVYRPGKKTADLAHFQSPLTSHPPLKTVTRRDCEDQEMDGKVGS